MCKNIDTVNSGIKDIIHDMEDENYDFKTKNLVATIYEVASRWNKKHPNPEISEFILNVNIMDALIPKMNISKTSSNFLLAFLSLQNAINDYRKLEESVPDSETLSKENESLKTDIEELKRKNESLETDIKNMNSLIEDLSHENDSLREKTDRISELEGENRQLKSRNASLVFQNNTLRKDLKELKWREDDYKNEHESFEKLKQENEKLKDKIKRLSSITKTLSEQISSELSKN